MKVETTTGSTPNGMKTELQSESGGRSIRFVEYIERDGRVFTFVEVDGIEIKLQQLPGQTGLAPRGHPKKLYREAREELR